MKPSTSRVTKVIYDQDGLGRRDHNLYGLFVLLQAPGVELIGLTTVSGREWSPRQAPRALRTLELLGRPDIPVAPGAIFPLVNTAARTALWEACHGRLFDLACFELDTEAGETDPFWLPPIDEGQPDTRALEESAAAFLVRMARQHPGELSIVATGPLTNLALACRLDPRFPQLVHELIFVGGRFRDPDPGFTRGFGRHEINFRHDPEAAHIVLHATWNRLTCLPRDLTDGLHVTRDMHAAIALARTPLARFVKRLEFDLSGKGDALAAALCAEPSLVKASDELCMDVDLDRGANYGVTLSWMNEAGVPALHGPPVRVITAVKEKAFAQTVVAWCRVKKAGASIVAS